MSATWTTVNDDDGYKKLTGLLPNTFYVMNINTAQKRMVIGIIGQAIFILTPLHISRTCQSLLRTPLMSPLELIWKMKR